jgi:AcrR family transcriptional regulator
MVARIKKENREEVLNQTRSALLKAAAEEIAQRGYDGANINHISTKAGFAKGTVYNYFPSKQALLLALIDQTAQAHLDFIAKRVLDEEDPIRRLECFFQAGFDFVTHNLHAGLVMINTIYGPDVTFKQHVYQAYLPMFQLVSREILTPGIQGGCFHQLDPDSTAGLLMTVYLGTGSSVNESGEPWLDAKQVSAFVLDGLRDRTPGSE